MVYQDILVKKFPGNINKAHKLTIQNSHNANKAYKVMAYSKQPAPMESKPFLDAVKASHVTCRVLYPL